MVIMQSNHERANRMDRNRDFQLRGGSMPARSEIACEGNFAPARRFRVGDRLRALVVDDDATTRRVQSRLLNMLKIHNSTAGDGLEAVAMAMAAADAGDPFAVILMDLEMPIVDGWSATMTLRANGFEGGIIAISGCTDPDVEQRCELCGFDLYLPKPIAALEVINAVGRFSGSNNNVLNDQTLPIPLSHKIAIAL
jgi:CheY-like chemotaxis protein